MGFPRQECWSGLPFPSLGDLPHLGLNPDLLHQQVSSLPLRHRGSPFCSITRLLILVICNLPAEPASNLNPGLARRPHRAVAPKWDSQGQARKRHARPSPRAGSLDRELCWGPSQDREEAACPSHRQLPRRVGAGHHRAPSQGLGEESSEKGARLLLGKRGMALGEETE